MNCEETSNLINESRRASTVLDSRAVLNGSARRVSRFPRRTIIPDPRRTRERLDPSADARRDIVYSTEARCTWRI